MTGTAVATTGGKKRAVPVAYNAAAFDASAAIKRAEKFASAVGGSLGGGSRFPGEKFTFSSGDWYYGIKAKQAKKALSDEPEIVVNVLQAAACWVKWEDKKPKFSDLRMLDGSTGDLEDRESLGDTDPDDWDTDPRSGRPVDPWKPVLVFPCRAPDSDKIDHIDLQTKSSTIAGYGLYRDVMAELSMHTGELPVVKLAARKVESRRKVMDPKKKKEVEVVDVYDVPVFEIVGWSEMLPCDVPGDKPAVEASGEIGDVESRQRTPKSEEPAPKAAKPAKRKVKPVDDDEDDSI